MVMLTGLINPASVVALNLIVVFVDLEYPACILLEDIDSYHHRNTEQVCYLDLLLKVAMAATCS